MSLEMVLLGAGKLAGHLAPVLKDEGFNLKAIYNRTLEHAAPLGQSLGVKVVDEFHLLPKADLYVLAVADDAIIPVAEKLSIALGPNIAVVHTSGATPGASLAKYFSQFGVLYFLQSFSKGKAVDFSHIPVCVDANHDLLRQKLMHIAQGLSEKVYEIDDQQRLHLHIAGVFVNNFVNHLYGLGHDILEKAAIPKEILNPIIAATANKIQNATAAEMQTGPAIRKDYASLERHQAALSEQPELLEIYQLISKQILNKY